MTKYHESFQAIQADFLRRGIPIDKPGFYDHPRFLEVERAYPEYLNNYAKFVCERPRDLTYDALVKEKAPVIAKIFHDKLKAHGRLGACIDISGLVSRALEFEGIWNYVVKGSLTIEFPEKSRIVTKYFWSVDTGTFTAAHAWIVAPPFHIIDISIRLQPYSDGEEKHLPEIVCSESESITKGNLDDIVSPEVRQYLASIGVPKNKQLLKASPAASQFIEVFPARFEIFHDTRMKFVPVAVTAPDTAFENMRAMLFENKTGYEIYCQEIRNAIS